MGDANSGRSGWGLRPVLVAIGLALFLVASSSYIAIKLGALPWPIIFSVVAGAGLMRIFGKYSKHELNVAHAGASIGGLMASALVFTIPGMWYLQSQGVDTGEISLWSLMAICLAAGLFGILVSIPIRKQLVEKENLPYPSGTAGAELIKAGFKGGSLIHVALISGLLAGVFALARDIWFPAGWTLFAASAFGIVIAVYPMPLAVGVGYILGPKASFSWFAGSVFGWVLLMPWLIGAFDNPAAFLQNLGMGLLLGAGIGFVIHHVFSRFKSIKEIVKSIHVTDEWRKIFLAGLASMIVLYIVGVPFWASIIAVLATLVVVFVAARMTGETNIDPLEQFGIIVGIICIALYSVTRTELGIVPAFSIVLFTSVAAAIAGDIGHDYKVAKILKTRWKDMVRVDIITVIVAAIAGPLVLELIRNGYADTLFTAVMPAPQAQLVAGSIFGFTYPSVFAWGFRIGLVYEVVVRYFKKSPFLMMPFAIGLFLGIPLGLLLFIGGLLAIYAMRKKVYDKGIVVSAGIMGGEGIAGFTVGALVVLGVASALVILKSLMAIFLVTLVIVLIRKKVSS